MVDEEITDGFADGDFKPARDVTRQAYMAFLYRMAGEPIWAGCDPDQFTDVTTEHAFCEEITWGAQMGITQGYPDGTFKPGIDVTRQAAAAFQYRAVGSPDHDHVTTFTDVPPTHEFHNEISWMDGEAIAEGYDDGTYKPGRDVTRQAAAAFLFRMDAAGFTVIPGSGPAATLTLAPQDDSNPVDTDHTVTATVEDEQGNPVSGEDVRFEVYPADGGAAIEASIEESANGDAAYTYTSADERDDIIVACTGTTRCTDDTELVVDPATGEPENISDDRVSDWAEKSWAAPVATALMVEPEADTNTYGQDHTTTATVVDQFGDPVDTTEEVHFEVFRTEDGGDTWTETEAGANRTTGADPSDDPAVSEAEETGQATYVYTGPSVDADDMIVACILEGTETDCAEIQTDDLGNESVVVTTESDFVDTADKQWVEPDYTVSLSQSATFNQAGTTHEYEAQVTDQFGEAAPAGMDVYSQVYRQFVADDGATEGDTTREETLVDATDADGVAEFTYTGPASAEFAARTDGDFDGGDADTAEDTIVGCVGVTAHDDCSQLDGSGNVAVNPDVASDQLSKTWAPVESAVADGTYTGEALSQDRTGNSFVMHTDDNRFIEFQTDAGSSDEFTVDGDDTADRDQFEIELQFQIANDADHTVVATLNNGDPFTANEWDLTTADLDGEYAEYDFVDISADGTQLGISGDDDNCQQVEMPFDVTFYDLTSVFVWVDSNGYLSVGSENTANCGDFSNEDLPSDDLGRSLAAFWDDIDPGDGGDIYVDTVGTEGDRTFIVQYELVQHFSNAGSVTFQVQIHEGTNDLEVHFEDVSTADAAWQNGASATLGIQQSEDGPSTKYSFNQETIFDGEALRYNTN